VKIIISKQKGGKKWLLTMLVSEPWRLARRQDGGTASAVLIGALRWRRVTR
jgi:hypothetical protein